MKVLRRLANSGDPDSLTVRLRRKRFQFFRSLMETVPGPVTILDVGGNEQFWVNMGFADEPDVRIHIVNLFDCKVTRPSMESSIADATHLDAFEDRQFDVVFSNSVIEHVGGLEDQRRMANEIMRVGKRYFLQTPNRYFPIEPHFLFPLFQFFPHWLKVAVVRHVKGVKDRSVAEKRAAEIELLSRKTLMSLFPGAKFYAERFGGMTKSWIVYDGWS